MDIQLQRAHPLRAVHKKQAPLSVRQLTQRHKISADSRRVAYPIESQDSCLRSKCGGHIFNSQITINRFHNVHVNAAPAKMKPCEEVGWKIVAPDNDIIARF